MQVLVLGATGAIGFAVARAFRRAGYKVYGLVRSEEKGKRLTLEEIIPIVGTIQDVDSWRPTLEKVTTVVDTTYDWTNPVGHADIVLNALKEVSQTRRLVYLYTSGTWVYGNNPNEITTENSTFTAPAMVGWRDPLDHKILAAESATLFPIVIRPTSIYGYGQSFLAGWFKGAVDGDLEVFGKPTTRLNFIHADDNAALFVRAAERADIVKGQIFIGTGGTESLLDTLTAVARVTGYKGEIKFKAPTDAFSECLAIENVLSSRKAQVLLGWEAKHKGFTDDIESLYVGWKAHNQ
jgi:nucleoside-diphosphate-sugar epimerase